MKKVALIMAKIILAGFFLYNIGFFSLFNNIESGPQPPFKADGGKGDQEYLNGKIRQAQMWGENYTPELYFADLTEIKIKQQNNDFDRSVVIMVNNSINELLAVFHENVCRHRQQDSEEEYQKFQERLTVAQKKCELLIDPDSQKRRDEFNAKVNRPGFWADLLLSIIFWLGTFYLKNFPLAFFLLWIWWYQEKEKIRINNPLSFLICLLLYPVTIIRVWHKSWRFGTRMWAMKIELKRRQTDIFSMISDDEMADIKRFAASNLKVSDYRQYLDNRGFRRQQALLPVMAITTLLLLAPKTWGAETSYCQNHGTIGYHLEVKAPPGINGQQLEPHDDQAASPAIVFFDHFIKPEFLVWKVIWPPAPEKHSGFKKNPDPVPLTY